jgi:hypothetical protein
MEPPPPGPPTNLNLTGPSFRPTTTFAGPPSPVVRFVIAQGDEATSAPTVTRAFVSSSSRSSSSSAGPHMPEAPAQRPSIEVLNAAELLQNVERALQTDHIGEARRKAEELEAKIAPILAQAEEPASEPEEEGKALLPSSLAAATGIELPEGFKLVGDIPLKQSIKGPAEGKSVNIPRALYGKPERIRAKYIDEYEKLTGQTPSEGMVDEYAANFDKDLAKEVRSFRKKAEKASR